MTTVGVSDEVAQELQMPIPQMLEDVEEPMLVRPATLRDPCTPDQSHSTQRVNDMNYNQSISDPSTYVKKRAQRLDDSILLRHMDDVVGTGPEEHLMSDFENMKTSLHLTDVVVLRH